MRAEVMRGLAFPKERRSLKLFSDFNNLQFASVMGLVMFVFLLIFMTEAAPHHYGYGTSVDLPKVLSPVSMPGANREDAIRVAITRDGQVYCGINKVALIDVSQNIKDRLKGPSVERKVYISADARARWGTVKAVLQAIHDAGVLRVSFLAYEHRFQYSHP